MIPKVYLVLRTHNRPSEFKNCINKNIPIDGLKIYNELINQ